MAAPAPRRPRPYRDFLTPALHRQFTRAGGLAFALCYVEAIYQGQADLLWSWFPIGPAGARTAMLAMSVLLVMIIRVARLHVGTRTTPSPLETFRVQLLSASTYITFVWYIISALLFAEVYIWARSSDAGFGVVEQGRAHERIRLNERPIAFRAMMALLGVVQSFVHMFSDRDQVPSPVRKMKTDPKTGPTTFTVASPLKLLKTYGRAMLKRFIWIAVLHPPLGFLVYAWSPLRGIAWRTYFDALRLIYKLPSKQRAQPTGFVPFFSLAMAVYTQTALLLLLWEFTNAAFSAYISQPPLKKGEPLTSDPTKGNDPNGSLINGLKSKKDFARASAFHELLLITTDFPDRRKTIYAELERAGGNTWSQISELCLAQVKSVHTRIEALTPTPPPPQPEIKARNSIAPPLKEGSIFVDAPAMGTPARTGEWAKSVAAKYGNSPGAKPLQDALDWSGRKLLTEKQRASLRPVTVEKRAESIFDAVLKSPVGEPFRATFARRVQGVVCGYPYSQAGVLCDAIDSLTRLVTASLKEDVYAQVAPSIPTIARTFAATIKAIQAFVAGYKPHWTDVEFTERKRARVEQVNEVLVALREGLAGILGSHAEFMAGMGVGNREINDWKALVGEKGQKEVPEPGREKQKAKIREAETRGPEMEMAR